MHRVQLLVSIFFLLNLLKVTQGSDKERKAGAKTIKQEEAICWQFSSCPRLHHPYFCLLDSSVHSEASKFTRLFSLTLAPSGKVYQIRVLCGTLGTAPVMERE